MTVITISTVGFREIRPLSAPGKVFTSALILVGVGALAYTVTKTMEAVIEQRLFHRRRIQMEIKRLSQHIILCGFGRMGRTVYDQLIARRIPVVVVEKDPEVARSSSTEGTLMLTGDATDDSLLLEAGIHRAAGLATLLPHDAENLFVTISARKLNPDLTIVARAASEKSEPKMQIAGASRVINPYRHGGQRVVRQLLHPEVTDFIEIISGFDEPELDLEQVTLQTGSSLTGIPLRDAPIRSDLDVIVVGVRRGDADLIFNPSPDLALEGGDVLVVLGRRENLQRLTTLAQPPNPG